MRMEKVQRLDGDSPLDSSAYIESSYTSYAANKVHFLKPRWGGVLWGVENMG
jgi:hypothetical protein